MQRNLAQSLFEHGEVKTTLAKAKDIRPFAEKLITLAKAAHNGSQTARRQIHKLLSDRAIIPAEHQEAYDGMSDPKRQETMRYRSGRRHRTGQPRGRQAFTSESVTYRLIHTIAPRFADRSGGYTRIIRVARPRIGDHSPQAIVQLVGQEKGPGSLVRPPKTARRRRADARYAFAVAMTRKTTRSDRPAAEPKAAEEVDSKGD